MFELIGAPDQFLKVNLVPGGYGCGASYNTLTEPILKNLVTVADDGRVIVQMTVH